MWQQRRVGRDHNDDRASFFLINFTRNLFADGDSSNCELRATSAISLNESADCIGASRFLATGVTVPGYRHDARCSSGSTFELVTDHPGPAADASLFDWASLGRLECVPDIFWLYVKPI